MTKVDKMGVYILLAHLAITLSVVVGYLVALVLDKPVANLETALFMILAYWFGAMGNQAIRPNSQTQVHNAQEVKVSNAVEPPKVDENV